MVNTELRGQDAQPVESHSGKKIVRLDVLRGLAILVVLFYPCRRQIPTGLAGSQRNRSHDHSKRGSGQFDVLTRPQTTDERQVWSQGPSPYA